MKTTGEKVRESTELLHSSAWACELGEVGDMDVVSRQSRGEGKYEGFNGFIAEVGVMVSQRLSLLRSSRERRSWRVLLCLSCRRLEIEGKFLAMWPLPVN
jgi:hypothetical protein